MLTSLAVLPIALSLVLPFLQTPVPTDSAYANPQTRALVVRARARHRAQDSLITDYRARIHSRLDMSVGRSRFARLVPLAAVEHIADIHWSLPDDLKIEYLGMRDRWLIDPRRLPGIDEDVSIQFEEPWFIPRGFSDRIRIVGDVPERGALHPFADSAEAVYSYAITDSVTLVLPERRVDVVGIEVRPRVLSDALIAGKIWVDAQTGDVVRLTFFLLGDRLWDDDPGDNATITRILRIEAEIEYTLWDQKYWLPLRELVSIHVREPWVTGAHLPIRSVVTFSDYQVNTGQAVEFEPELNNAGPADGDGFLRGDSDEDHRWQIVSPPTDSLRRYVAWEIPLSFAPASGDRQRILDMASELAAVGQDMPAQWVGRTQPMFTELGTILRYNRIQGPSIGASYQFEPAWPFTTIVFRGRFGFSDLRPLGGIVLRRDLPSGFWEWELARTLTDVDPWSRGLNLANTVNALFAGHDDAEYLLVDRLQITNTRPLGATNSWTWSLGVENHSSVDTEAESRVNDLFFGDGLFQTNRPARERLYGALGTRFEVRGTGVRWSLGGRALIDDDLVVGRVWTNFTLRRGPVQFGLATGAVTRPDVPQMLLRAGGPLTVRGYDYGERIGEGMWAVQLTTSLRPTGFWNPYFFADAGNATPYVELFSSAPLAGVGAGVAFNLYLVEARVQLSKAIGRDNDEPARLDLLFRPPL